MKTLRFLAIIIIITAIAFYEKFRKEEKDIKLQAKNTISDLYERFNSELGYGVVDYDKKLGHEAKSYAVLLSSIIKLNQTFGELRHQNSIREILNWLLDNCIVDTNGNMGWGVSVSWDAYGDGTINPVNTVYTISSSMVLESLIDYLESGNLYRRDEVRKILDEVFDVFTRPEFITSEGLIAYSLNKNDIKYNTFNSAAHMMGQMQRYSQYAKNSLKIKLKLTADSVAKSLSKHKNEDTEQIYWNYSIGENVPNDLSHFLFILNGVYNYIKYEGTYAHIFNFDKIKNHLNSFNKDRDWFFYPQFFKEKTKARLEGLAFLISSLVNIYKTNHAYDVISYVFNNYKISNNSFSRWQKESLDINEYNAYFFKALVDLNIESNYIKIDSAAFLQKKSKALDEKGVYTVPFIEFDHNKIKVNLKTNNFVLSKGENEIRFDGVPLGQCFDSKIFFRKLYTNDLYIYDLLSSKNYLLSGSPGTFLDLRKIVDSEKNCMFIAYDSIEGSNSLYKIQWLSDGISLQKIKLPSVKYPSGATYESIPSYFITRDGMDNLYIFSGQSACFYSYKESKCHNLELPEDVYSIIDSKIIDGRVGIAYLSNEANYKIVSFEAGNFSQSKKIHFSEKTAILKIGAQFNKPIFINKDNISEFLRSEIRLHNNGAMYLGTNNREGWSVWNQIYYLNGILSLIDLSNRTNRIKLDKVFYSDLVTRFFIETYFLAEQYFSKESLKSSVFTIDRKPAWFAVQSSRYVNLCERSSIILGKNLSSNFFKMCHDMKKKSFALSGHLEVLGNGNTVYGKKIGGNWIDSSSYFLYWPKGINLKWDGLNVPYNHQNEWASVVIDFSDNKDLRNKGKQIIEIFIKNSIKYNYFQKGTWSYWWGIAYDGYGSEDKVSLNTKAYAGDKGEGWITFRTIDAVSVVSYHRNFTTLKNSLSNDIQELASEGKVLPYILETSVKYAPKLQEDVILKYIRFTDLPNFQNVPWVLDQYMSSDMESYE